MSEPAKLNAGRPTVLTLGGTNWKDLRKLAYLDQVGPRPFASTYDRRRWRHLALARHNA